MKAYKRRPIVAPVINGVRYISIISLADKTGYSVRHLYRLAQTGAIRGKKVGVKYFFHPRTLSDMTQAPDIEAPDSDDDYEDFIKGL